MIVYRDNSCPTWFTCFYKYLPLTNYNEDTYYEVEGVKFKIPADGNFYWFDVGRNHAVANNGTADRITLSVNLSVYDNYDSSHNLMDLIKNCKV